MKMIGKRDFFLRALLKNQGVLGETPSSKHSLKKLLEK